MGDARKLLIPSDWEGKLTVLWRSGYGRCKEATDTQWGETKLADLEKMWVSGKQGSFRYPKPVKNVNFTRKVWVWSKLGNISYPHSEIYM